MDIQIKRTNKTQISDDLKQSVSKSYLCVVMPAYNEEAIIKDNLLSASSIISEFADDYKIIAVNDGSSDNTEKFIIEASALDSHISYVSYAKNQGKGGAIKAGVKYANADYIAFLDSDLELSPVMLKNFLKALKKRNADIAIGSKLHKDSKLEYPFTRRILSFGYYVMLKLMFKLNLKDTQTGIKLFKSSIIKPICETLTTTGFAFDIEILAKASKKGAKIIEMPIELNFTRDKREKSRISPKVIYKVFKDTLSIKKSLK